MNELLIGRRRGQAGGAQVPPYSVQHHVGDVGNPDGRTRPFRCTIRFRFGRNFLEKPVSSWRSGIHFRIVWFSQNAECRRATGC